MLGTLALASGTAQAQTNLSDEVKAYGPAMAAIATGIAAILTLIGTLIVNHRTLSVQRDIFDRQIRAQREQSEKQMDAQREQSERQMNAQREQSERQMNAQREQFEQQRRDALASFDRQQAAALQQRIAERSQAVSQELLVTMASALHSICWITWVASENAERLTQNRIEAYDAEMHSVLPKVSGLLASLSALNLQDALALRDFVNRIYGLDVRLGQAGLLFSTDPAASAASFARLHRMGRDMEEELLGLLPAPESSTDVAQRPDSLAAGGAAPPQGIEHR